MAHGNHSTIHNPQLAIELREIPKIELHVHLEGSLTESQLRYLAKKYRTPLWESQTDAVAELYNFQTFPDFLNAYKVCCQHLRTPEDYVQLTGSLLQQLADQHCVYAEILFTPSICSRFGLPAEEVIEAVLQRSIEASRSGPHIRWVFDTVRQWGPDLCWQTLEWAIRYQEKGVAGICIGGDEASEPARRFREVFESAEKAGLHRVAHAGEICDARSVWLAIEELRAERIAHGIRALQDPLLVDYLVGHRLPLDVCITSNFKTGVVERDQPHPIENMARSGIPFTLNSDDPGLFQTSLLQEWERAAEILHWLPEQFVTLTRQTLQYAFLTSEERRQFQNLIR
ncbi:MAG: adenosine deaminase [Acidobacteria bacterium]|nr:adenosine deaminase [Acidobacteriota bacterium]